MDSDKFQHIMVPVVSAPNNRYLKPFVFGLEPFPTPLFVRDSVTIFLRGDRGDFADLEDLGDLTRGDLDVLEVRGDFERPGDLDRDVNANGVSSDLVDLCPLFRPRGNTNFVDGV